ncbi:glycosyltransferase [Paenibacillus sp. FSL E2-0201]|uniref:glycosyltransferase family 2 protein n=1 Tax=Paenibacillus sp. FSL E2-0201 TaxID=2954726 RepID=UPI0030DA1680
MVDVGVVMPLYTQKPEFLRQALESVLRQTFTEFRLIIVIDGAPEMEPLVQSIIAEDPRVAIISYVPNRGIAHALNTGFDLLFNEPNIQYLSWVSSDNVYEPRFLEILRGALVKGPQALGIVYSSFQSIDNEGNQLHNEHQLATQRNYQSQPKERLLDYSLIGVSFMYKSQVAKLVGGYGMEPVEDYDYWLRLAEHCDIRFIPVELVNYRVDSTFSVSAQLHSIENHRRWRYTYHLTRHQARFRRGIPPMITVLFPVVNAGAEEIARIENLYEQTYSNYECRVLDLSPTRQPSVLLGSIPHPATEFVWMPEVVESHAICGALEHMSTPYTIVLGPKIFIGALDIEYMLEALITTGGDTISNYYTDDHSLIGFRNRHDLSTKTHYYNELFQSADLYDLLKIYFS